MQSSATHTDDPRGRPAGFPRSSVPLALSTDHHHPADRFEWWRSQFRSLHEVVIPPDERLRFRAHARHWRLGATLIGSYSTPARNVVRRPIDCRRDGVDDIWIAVSPRSRFANSAGGRDTVAEPGIAVVSTFAHGYLSRFESGDWVTAILPRSLLPARVVHAASAHPRLLDSTAGRVASDVLLSIARHAPDAGPEAYPRLERLLRAALCEALADDPEAVSENDARTVLRARVTRIITENIGSARLDPERLCALAGVSRSVLYRAFETTGGVQAHVTALRLDHAWRELRDPQGAVQPIARIAGSVGMHNASAFSRAFRNRFGHTPGEVRDAGRGVKPAGDER